MKNNKAVERLNELISRYEFPIEVLTDINNRLKDNDSESYVWQQVRYLENVLKFRNYDVKLK